MYVRTFRDAAERLRRSLEWEKEQIAAVIHRFRFFNSDENRRWEPYALDQAQIDRMLARLARRAVVFVGNRGVFATVDLLREHEEEAVKLMRAERAKWVVRIEAPALGRLVLKAFEAGYLTSPSLWRHLKVAVGPTSDRSARRLWRSIVEVSLGDDYPKTFNMLDKSGWRELEHSIQACNLLSELVAANAGLKSGRGKAEKTNRRGRPKVSDARHRQSILRMYHARPRGMSQKQFCDEKSLDHAVLKRWLTWERTRARRKSSKTDEANKNTSSRR